MNKLVTGLLSFTLGAGIGSLVTWRLIKTKYERLADEEIERQVASVKETYYKRMPVPVKKELETKVEPSDDSEGSSNFRDYAEVLAKEGYVDYSTKNIEKPSDTKKPYVIEPEEFGELDEYETMSYTYYADGVLVDDGGDVIKDVDNAVGKDSLTHFGEFEDDSVHVRNDKWKCDIEILLDPRTYTEILSRKSL